MDISTIIQITEHKITSLRTMRDLAYNSGELQAVVDIEGQIAETENTLNKIKTLSE